MCCYSLQGHELGELDIPWYIFLGAILAYHPTYFLCVGWSFYAGYLFDNEV